METPKEFENIRPYLNEELPQVYEELIQDEVFRRAMTTVFPDIPFEDFAQKMRGCATSLAFQEAFCLPFLDGLLKKLSRGGSMEFKNDGLPHLFLSNHRDIVLDSAFLSLFLVKQTKDTVEIAIGDNLLIYPWIKKLVRVNRSFIVQRSASLRELLLSSMRLSRYVRFTIEQKRSSIWMAQREGRAKDANDRTQESVLKMLAMNNKANPIEALQALHISPVTISYEFDPCDYLKAAEFQRKRDCPDFKKSTEDDLNNMVVGMFGYKGAVHYKVSEPLDNRLKELEAKVPKNELFSHIRAMVDKAIHLGYRLYPVNYYSYELLTGDKTFASKVSSEERNSLDGYLVGQIDKIELKDKDVPFLRKKILEMYANPLINQLKAQQE